jgi:hypothetical protein
MPHILELVIVAGTAILSIRLFTSGLYGRYRAFFSYLIFTALHDGVLTIPKPTGKLYYLIWTRTEPVEWLFFALVVLEIYALVLQDYKGLSTVGRWALIAAVVLALLASGLSVMAPSHDTIQGPLLRYYYVAERGVYFSLAVFLLTILGVLMQYPIGLNRNILVHSIVFSVYFLADTVIYLLLSTLGHGAWSAVRLALDAITLGALVTWLAMLNPAGELRKQSLRPAWMPGREEELVSQLNHLNAALLRATRK